MKFTCTYVVCLCLLLPLSSAAQQPSPQRDPQALSVAMQAYNALGGAMPGDSRAVGTYARTIGSSADSGTIEILTRSSNQTSEKLTSFGKTSQLVYSRGYASQLDQDSVTQFVLEKSLASSSAIFSLPLIANGLQDPNSTVQFVGTETVNGVPANHIRVCPSSPDQNFTDIVSLGTKDIWVAIDSGLPLEVSYQVLEGQGSTAAVPVTMFFSQYQAVSGVKYPFHVEEFSNGTPYMAITITSVAFGVGLRDQDFPLR
jgi:hypothetical protein